MRKPILVKRTDPSPESRESGKFLACEETEACDIVKSHTREFSKEYETISACWPSSCDQFQNYTLQRLQVGFTRINASGNSRETPSPLGKVPD